MISKNIKTHNRDHTYEIYKYMYITSNLINLHTHITIPCKRSSSECFRLDPILVEALESGCIMSLVGAFGLYEDLTYI